MSGPNPSTGDEFCGPCGHPRQDHDRDGCRTCPGDDERSWRHQYQPETTTGEQVEPTDCTVCGHIPQRHYDNNGQPYCAQCPADGRWRFHGLNTPINPDPARYGRRVDEMPPGVTGVVTVAERIVNPAALHLPPLTGRVHPIGLDAALNALHHAGADEDDPARVNDLDEQLTAVVAGLLRFATDPAGVTSRALLIYPDNPVHREGALKRLVEWRTGERVAAIESVREASDELKNALSQGLDDVDDYESLFNARHNHDQTVSAALDAARAALANHQEN